MNVPGLLNLLAPDPALRAAVEGVGAPSVDVSAPPGLRPFLLATLAARTGRTVLAVTATSREAEDLVTAVQSLLPADSVVDYPAWETLPHERLGPPADTVGRGLAFLRGVRPPVPRGSPPPGPADPATNRIAVFVAQVRSIPQPQVPALGALDPVSLRPGDD